MPPTTFAPLPQPPSDQFGLRRGRRKRPLISLTPLIDVVFILLVFFMLASSFLDWRSIELNAPGRAGGQPSMIGAMLIDVTVDGPRLAGTPISLDALYARVSARLEQRPEQRVLVKPDPDVRLQAVVDVLDRLSEAGVVDLSLIRDRTQ